MAELFPHDGATRVVNLKRGDEFDVYGGRARGGKPPHLCDVGEEGWLGNPHPIARCGAMALPFFRRYLRDRLVRDPKFRAGVEALRGKRLGCFCKPRPCHLDVVVEWLETGAVRIDPRESEPLP